MLFAFGLVLHSQYILRPVRYSRLHMYALPLTTAAVRWTSSYTRIVQPHRPPSPGIWRTDRTRVGAASPCPCPALVVVVQWELRHLAALVSHSPCSLFSTTSCFCRNAKSLTGSDRDRFLPRTARRTSHARSPTQMCLTSSCLQESSRLRRRVGQQFIVVALLVCTSTHNVK